MKPKAETGADEARSYSSSEVVRLTGTTARQLQWWDEQGIVVPARQGRNRCYGFEDLAELRVIAALRRKGFSLQRVRQMMRFLQQELGERLATTVTAGGEYHLLTDGETVYVADSAERVVDIIKSARQGVFAVCLTDEIEDLRKDLDGSKGEGTGEVRNGRTQHPITENNEEVRRKERARSSSARMPQQRAS